MRPEGCTDCIDGQGLLLGPLASGPASWLTLTNRRDLTPADLCSLGCLLGTLVSPSEVGGCVGGGTLAMSREGLPLGSTQVAEAEQ